jgi:phosphatidate cytidylyltransferase
MIIPILIFVTFYFIIGFVMTHIASRRLEADKRKQRWIKYYVYVAIIYPLLLIIHAGSGYFFVLATIIVLIGFFEIIMNYIRAVKMNLWLLFITPALYAWLAWGFLFFSLMDTQQVLLVTILVIAFDGFSQIIGQVFGKTKLISVSPNKTVEGLVGGLALTIVTALSCMTWTHATWQKAIFQGTLIATAAFTGDVLASWYKRKVGVKDYSRLIPGHGGVLDRFDSLIGAGAAWYIYTLSTNIL